LLAIDDAGRYTAELDYLIAAPTPTSPTAPPSRIPPRAAVSASHASVWNGAQLALALDEQQKCRLGGSGASGA